MVSLATPRVLPVAPVPGQPSALCHVEASVAELRGPVEDDIFPVDPMQDALTLESKTGR